MSSKIKPAPRIFVFVMSGAFEGAEEKVLKSVERCAMVFGDTFYFLEAVVEFEGEGLFAVLPNGQTAA